MNTKERLKEAQESVNIALLKLKQSYSNSSTSKKVFFIVEGKDDIPFYGTKADEYVPDDWKLIIIPANNRKNVLDVYDRVDWSSYNKKRIYFFVDRDLSDYTGEYTPEDTNIYITKKYSIENDLCTFDTLVKAVKYYYGLNDIDEPDENAIECFYNNCWSIFSTMLEPIMAQILYWKYNGVESNYANFKIQNIFEINDNTLQRKNVFLSDENVISELCRQSNINYIEIDLSKYKEILKSINSSENYIRGKYILVFFVKVLVYISQNSEVLLPSKKKAKDTIGIGYENAISKLCGIMKLPDSLRKFYIDINNELKMLSV